MSGVETEVEWVEVPPEFGAAMPNGSCNAAGTRGAICGFPRRADGTCLNGHPAPPGLTFIDGVAYFDSEPNVDDGPPWRPEPTP